MVRGSKGVIYRGEHHKEDKGSPPELQRTREQRQSSRTPERTREQSQSSTTAGSMGVNVGTLQVHVWVLHGSSPLDCKELGNRFCTSSVQSSVWKPQTCREGLSKATILHNVTLPQSQPTLNKRKQTNTLPKETKPTLREGKPTNTLALSRRTNLK